MQRTSLELVLALGLCAASLGCRGLIEPAGPPDTTSPTASATTPVASSRETPTPAQTMSPSPGSTGSPDGLPEDVYRLGSVRIASPNESADAVSLQTAFEAAASSGYDWPDPDSYLVVVTRPGTTASDDPVVDRLAWLIRWDRLYIEFPQPLPADGTPLPPHPYRYGYVLVDALTAEVLGATYMD